MKFKDFDDFDFKPKKTKSQKHTKSKRLSPHELEEYSNDSFYINNKFIYENKQS